MSDTTDRQICEVAIRLPWYTKKYSYSIYCRGVNEGDEVIAEVAIQHHGDAKRQHNLQFIAHFNPFKVASMLDQIEALEKRVEELEKEVSYCRERGFIMPKERQVGE